MRPTTDNKNWTSLISATNLKKNQQNLAQVNETASTEICLAVFDAVTSGHAGKNYQMIPESHFENHQNSWPT